MSNRLWKRSTVGVLWIAVAVAASQPLAAQSEASVDEVLEYRWRLQGVPGLVGRLFFPTRGDGTLITSEGENGRLESELKVTARKAGGDFWLYGALIEPARSRTVRAWNSYRFRKREKERKADLDDPEIIDITSGIYMLRNDPPSSPRPLKIWSDGKIYPVLVSPEGVESRKIGGRSASVEHFSVTARKVPGERVWSGRMDIWFAPDEVSTPVEIDFRAKRGRVRMVLTGGDEEP
jgi:hypothetical protein